MIDIEEYELYEDFDDHPDIDYDDDEIEDITYFCRNCLEILVSETEIELMLCPICMSIPNVR